MYISDKDFEKIEYLLGFVNTVAEIVCDPEEMLDPNTGDSTVYSIGLSVDSNDNVEFCTIDGSEEPEDFRDTLSGLEDEIISASRVDFSKKWAELRS